MINQQKSAHFATPNTRINTRMQPTAAAATGTTAASHPQRAAPGNETGCRLKFVACRLRNDEYSSRI